MADSYQDLIVWQKGMDLVEEVYRIVKLLPKEELYALSDQMRRAVVSIPSNIAEGKNRLSVNEYKHFLTIARGSAAELETQLIVCNRLQYLSENTTEKAIQLCAEVSKMLCRMISKM